VTPLKLARSSVWPTSAASEIENCLDQLAHREVVALEAAPRGVDERPCVQVLPGERVPGVDGELAQERAPRTRQPLRPRLARQRHDHRRQTPPSVRPVLQGPRPSPPETPESRPETRVTKAGATGVEPCLYTASESGCEQGFVQHAPLEPVSGARADSRAPSSAPDGLGSRGAQTSPGRLTSVDAGGTHPA
jgi:hypothetical protein